LLYEILVGSEGSKSDLTRSLLAYLVRRGQIDKLIEICVQSRPNAEWTVYGLTGTPQVPTEPQPPQPSYLRIFLCHSTSDKPAVRELYRKLKADGYIPWLDEEDILPGQDWELVIANTLRESDIIIICSSPESVSKTGYVQKEIRFALDRALEQPEGSIFLIPLKLQPCDLPHSLNKYQWVNYYEDNGYQRLTRALRARAASLGIRPTDEYRINPDPYPAP